MIPRFPLKIQVFHWKSYVWMADGYILGGIPAENRWNRPVFRGVGRVSGGIRMDYVASRKVPVEMVGGTQEYFALRLGESLNLL